MHNMGFYRSVRKCPKIMDGDHYELETESEPLLLDLDDITSAYRVDACFDGRHDGWSEATKVRTKNNDTFFLSIDLDQLAKLTRAEYVIAAE